MFYLFNEHLLFDSFYMYTSMYNDLQINILKPCFFFINVDIFIRLLIFFCHAVPDM